MKRNVLFFAILLLMFIFCSDSTFCYARPRTQSTQTLKTAPQLQAPVVNPVETTRRTASIPDEPSIREFSVSPTSVSPNNRISKEGR